MARHGENIRKRKDGRWEGRYLTYSKEKGRKLYRSVYGRTYEAAKEKLTMKKISLLNLQGNAGGSYRETPREAPEDVPGEAVPSN